MTNKANKLARIALQSAKISDVAYSACTAEYICFWTGTVGLTKYLSTVLALILLTITVLIPTVLLYFTWVFPFSGT